MPVSELAQARRAYAGSTGSIGLVGFMEFIRIIRALQQFAGGRCWLWGKFALAQQLGFRILTAHQCHVEGCGAVYHDNLGFRV